VALTALSLSASIVLRADDGCPSTAFVQATTFACAQYPTALAAGDFTGDGKADLVTSSNPIAVLPGNGDGTFGAPIPSPYSPFAGFAIPAFLDGDSNLDLILGGDPIEVYLGNGDGTFTFLASYNAGNASTAGFASGDFNGDGKLDLVLTSRYYTSGLWILLGHGDGTFDPPVSYPVAITPQAVATGDFNGDGRSDVVVPAWEGDVFAVYLANADGSLGEPTYVTVGLGMLSAEAADWDGDGHVDLAIGRDDFVDVLYGNGDGTFQAAIEYPAGLGSQSLRALDVNGDGKLDIVCLQVGSLGFVTTLFQTETGGFASPVSYLSSDFLSFTPLTSADFNGDGLPDFALTSDQRNTVSILLSGGPRLHAAPAVALATPPGPPATGDFDGDGIDEVVVAGGFSPPSVSVLGRDDAGHYVLRGTTAVSPSITIDGILAADFDGDTHLDVAILPNAGVMLGRGDFTFGPPQYPVAPFNSSIVAAGDFNGDGKQDLAFLGDPPTAGQVATLLGNGDGTFQPAIPGPAQLHPAASVLAADLNGDGIPDLVTADATCCGYGSDTISVFLASGDGTFAEPVDYATGSQPISVAAGDFDGDGHVDLAVANSGSTNVSVFFGDGTGAFAPGILIGVGWRPAFVASGDFDGDGISDLATANGSGGNGSTLTVSALRGTGQGGFEAPVLYDTPSDPKFLAVGNFDGAGGDDLAVSASGNDRSVMFLLSAILSASISVGPAVIGQPVVLHASASGYGSVTYRWRKNGTPLSDGGTISGAHTATLTIDPVSFSDAGSYDVLVTDSCASAGSNAGTLSVEFADVPVSSPFHDDILSIATEGITGGCGGGNYCPTSPVRRDQMAVFLLKSEHGSAYTPPGCTGAFADVACPGTFTDWIEQLAAEGVTGGCGGGNYCPSQSVTRAQMAIFLLKTSQGSSYTPPTAVGIFGDVPVGSFGADFIEDLYNKGITGGCQLSPLLYCPGNAVLRQQMATFLVRTFAP
jgi:hypothetical protein